MGRGPHDPEPRARRDRGRASACCAGLVGATATEVGLADRPAARQGVAAAYVRERVLDLHLLRVKAGAGEASIVKLMYSEARAPHGEHGDALRGLVARAHRRRGTRGSTACCCCPASASVAAPTRSSATSLPNGAWSRPRERVAGAKPSRSA